MIMAAEKNFENKVKAFLKEQGCWFIKYWAGGEFTKAGVPDLLICCNGHFLGVELKAPKGKPSELQLWNISKINQAGGIGMVLYPKDFEDFKALIHKLLAN
jgi:Holliday junction resolvase